MPGAGASPSGERLVVGPDDLVGVAGLPVLDDFLKSGVVNEALSASRSARAICTIPVAVGMGLWSSAGTRMWREAANVWICPESRMTCSMSLRN